MGLKAEQASGAARVARRARQRARLTLGRAALAEQPQRAPESSARAAASSLALTGSAGWNARPAVATVEVESGGPEFWPAGTRSSQGKRKRSGKSSARDRQPPPLLGSPVRRPAGPAAPSGKPLHPDPRHPPGPTSERRQSSAEVSPAKAKTRMSTASRATDQVGIGYIGHFSTSEIPRLICRR